MTAFLLFGLFGWLVSRICRPFRFSDLRFKERPYISGLYQARHRGCSIIYGTYIDGYEIMDSNGDVRDGLTEEQVVAFFK